MNTRRRSASRMGSVSGSTSKKKKLADESTFITHISQIPEMIMICIISLLPTKDLMVASLVSRLWKRMVVSHLSMASSTIKLSELEVVKKFITDRVPNPIPEFQGSFFQTYLMDKAKTHYVDFVSRTLSIHAGCMIENLELWLHHDINDRYAGRNESWVHFSITNKIRVLSLDFSNGDSETTVTLPKRFNLRMRKFSSMILHSLSLTYCKIDSFTFGSMISLHKLVLKSVKIFSFSIGVLASAFPVLEEVALHDCLMLHDFMLYEKDLKIKSLSVINCRDGTTESIDIDLSVPELVTLVIVASSFGTISLRKSEKLENATIDGSSLDANFAQGDVIASLLYSLRYCNTVSLHSYGLQVLPTGDNILEEMPNHLTHVQHLKLTTGLGKQELPGIACLVRSCPNLKTLSLTIEESIEVEFYDSEEEIFMYDEENYWDTQGIPFLCFNATLKEVVINGFGSRKREIDVAKFLLNNAMFLEKLELYYGTKTTKDLKAKSSWYPIFDHPLLDASKLSANVQISAFKPLVVLGD